MTEALRHRGPDDSGIFTDPHTCLGHRRLAILDPSPAGHQPMSRGPLTIVYNGEIYNFKELRSSLPGPFSSNTDTEVLLALYEQEGPRMLQRLVGMFAFAIWDERQRSLFAARDRLGIKPLLYRQLDDGRFAFASEIKALLCLERPDLSLDGLRDFFTYKYIPSPKTIFRGIRKLPPAHWLRYDGELRIERYWSPSSCEDISDPKEAEERFAALVSQVVDDHTLSDVPIGVFLSGGIDSTTVAVNVERPSTFTLGFDVRSHDETDVARSIAEHIGADHHTERSRGVDLEEALDRLPLIYDQPFGDHGAWPMHLIARLAVRRVKVALTGEGGDELFAGYHWYAKVPRFRSSVWKRLAARLLPPLTALGRSTQRRAAEGLERYSMFLGPFTPAQKTALLSPALMADGDYDDLWHFRKFWKAELSPIKRMQWLDLHTYLADDMLPKVDLATMAVSLEARPPFVDHRMVEFALRLAPDLLRRGDEGKVLSRRYLQPRLPPGVLDRPKIGFSMPVRRWVKRQPELLRAALGRLYERGLLKSPKKPYLNSEQTWSLLVLDRFLERNDCA